MRKPAVVGILLAVGATAMANTVQSSTIWFEGTLTYDSGTGAYTGTIAMIDEATASVGDGIAGFDVYARNGAWATYDTVSSGSGYTAGVVANHDAYTGAGGWGTFWSPDCADWYNYQLRLTDTEWFLEYNGDAGNDGDLTGATAPPMSGLINWSTGIATETGTGAYYGASTPENPGGAAAFAASKG